MTSKHIIFFIFISIKTFANERTKFCKVNFVYGYQNYFELTKIKPKGISVSFGLKSENFTHQINIDYTQHSTKYQLYNFTLMPSTIKPYYYKYNNKWLNIGYGLSSNIVKRQRQLLMCGINIYVTKPISAKETIKEIPSGITHTLELAQPNTYIFYGGLKAEYFYFPFNNLGFNIAICGGRNFNRTYTRSLFLQSSVGVTYKL